VACFDEDKYHVVPTRLFREMVKRTIFITDAENSPFALGGVLLEMEDAKEKGTPCFSGKLSKKAQVLFSQCCPKSTCAFLAMLSKKHVCFSHNVVQKAQVLFSHVLFWDVVEQGTCAFHVLRTVEPFSSSLSRLLFRQYV
jgi:hypothetical protein